MTTLTLDNKRIAKKTLLLCFRMLFMTVVLLYTSRVVLKNCSEGLNMIIMTEQQYNELLKAYCKEAFANIIKVDIRYRFLEPYASIYCQQFDNLKMLQIPLKLQQK